MTNKGAQKIGHITGLIAYGLTATVAAVAAGIVESTVRGLAQTGKSLASELRPPTSFRAAPEAPAAQEKTPASPAEQKKASEAPKRRKRSRKRSKQEKAPEAR